LQRLRGVRPLPRRVVAIVRGGFRRLWHQRSRRPCRLSQSAGIDAGAAARPALLRETGAAISCGTGTAYGALRRMNLSGRDTIAIFGQGPVGLSATQLAVAMGARVIALDVGTERLARAKEFGAAEAVNPQTHD